MSSVKERILKIAVINAVRYNGKAKTKPVLSKVLYELPKLDQNIKEISLLVDEVVNEVNQLSIAQQKKIVHENWPKTLVVRKAEKNWKLPPLQNVGKYKHIVTRFSPNPDFVLHLGSARAIILSHDYARMYEGAFYLRFEDTDPRLKKSVLIFYDAIREDLKWLDCTWDAEFIQSDRLQIYYKYAERLLKEGNAYVCTCKRGEFRRKVVNKHPCSCRELPSFENLIRWEYMLDGTYSVGNAVVRVKTNLNHPNPAVRDWPALRIIDVRKSPHPRMGSRYRVWPLYNFACGIDDHLMNVTHIIRGKEHLTNQVRQQYLYEHFGWEYPEAIHYGRLKIAGASLSKSEMLQGVKNGLFESWEDPRIATIASLRKRGIKSEAIRRIMTELGTKPADVSLSWENLYACNRKIIDPIANRYFFVCDPIKLNVGNISKSITVNLLLHPDHPERGARIFRIKPKERVASFWISRDDMNLLRECKVTRLMELFNIQVEKIEKNRVNAVFHSKSYKKASNMKSPLIHWIPINNEVRCEVVMPDASVAEGFAESNCKTLIKGEVIQLERFGFVRVDDLDEKLIAYFAHR
jgi:glutamyl-tRNA synthetase